MKATAEARWFIEGDCPRAEKWFQQNGKTFTHTWPESHYYLPLEDAASLSAKIRDDKFEIKQRIQCKAVTLQKVCEGYLERWFKWEMTLANQTAARNIFREEMKEVKKERLLLFFSKENNAAKVLLEKPEEGCQVELSKIKLANRTFTSMALEAFGSDQNLERYLMETSALVLPDIDAGLFSLKHSMNYATFIKTVK